MTMNETAYRMIALADIGESPLNPRSHYDIEDLEELSASIAEVGILEPLLVRPRILDTRSPGVFFPFEIVAGHRRARAARMVKLDEVPCLVRELDDAQAIECALVENGQRADVTVLDEATAFSELVRLGRSEAQIAAKIGRSIAYVSQRMRLLSLDASVHDLMDREQLLMGGALLLAQLEPERQREAVARLARYGRVLTRSDVAREVAMTARRVSLAVWPLGETAHGPACSTCPKRTATQRSLFVEAEDDLCLDGACWSAKSASWLAQQREAGRQIAEGVEADKITRWDAPWVLFDDDALTHDDDDQHGKTWGEVLSGVLAESLTTIVVNADGEIRLAALAVDVAETFEDDWPEAAAELRRKAQRFVGTTPAERPVAPVESAEDRAAREAKNAATDLERKINEETYLATIERIAVDAERGNARTARCIAIACAEALGVWMLPELAERRGIEGGSDGMRAWMSTMDDDQALGVIAEMLAIRYVRNAAPGEVHAAIAPLLSALRIQPEKIREEVALRYAPKARVKRQKKATKRAT